MPEIKTEIRKVGNRHYQFVFFQPKCVLCCFEHRENTFCAELSCNNGHFEEIVKTKKSKSHVNN